MTESTTTETTPDETPATPAPTPEQEEKLTPDEARQTQHPSLHGQTNVEIAERTPDAELTKSGRRKTSKTHTKVFVAPHGFNLDDYDHTANIFAVRQYMLNLGLRPVGDVQFDGESTNIDGVSVDLTYSVDAVPSVIATDPDVVHTTVDPDGSPYLKRDESSDEN